MTTPAALVLALPAAAPTSSSDEAASLAMAATSSSRAARPEAMGDPYVGERGGSDQSMGSRPASRRNALAREKCPQPKKPLCADRGDGWTDVRTRWRPPFATSSIIAALALA